MNKLAGMRNKDVERVRAMQETAKENRARSEVKQERAQKVDMDAAERKREAIRAAEEKLPRARATSDSDKEGGRAGFLRSKVGGVTVKDGAPEVTVRNVFEGVDWVAHTAMGWVKLGERLPVRLMLRRMTGDERDGESIASTFDISADEARALAAWVQLHLKDEP